MANIQYINNKEGEIAYPVTHEKAVRDDNGNTLDSKIKALQEAYAGLTQSDIIIGTLPASGVTNTIYRVPGTSSYSDYMWDGTQFVPMATYNNAIDAVPTAGSENLVSSGGVYSEIVKMYGYIVNTEVTVNNNSQRNKNYTLPAGTKKVVIRVSNVTGTSTRYNANWIKAGGNVEIFGSYPLGYMSDVLDVPADATGINLFITPSASGNKSLVEIWDATFPTYLIDKIGAEGITYLHNRKIISSTINVEVSSSYQYLRTIQDARLTPLEGDIYAYIEGSAQFDLSGKIRFNTTDGSLTDICGIMLRQQRLFKLFDGKSLNEVFVYSDAVSQAGTLSITLFAVTPAITMLHYPLYGKKIMCFGDSITEFKYSADNWRYSDHLARLSHADVFNAGVGGTRLAYRTTPSLTPADNQTCVAAFEICSLVKAWATGNYDYQDAALATTVLITDDQRSTFTKALNVLKNNPISDFDIVTIFGGTNDYTGPSVIGTPSASNTDMGTVYGAVNMMASYLLTANPKIKIYQFSPTIRMFGNNVSQEYSSDNYIPTDAPDGKSLPEFCDTIEDAAKKNHITFNNWYWSLGWNMYNWSEYFIDTDGTHPYKGFQYLAEKMYKFLLSK